jgi:manganese/zinc/iron transport system permease protein
MELFTDYTLRTVLLGTLTLGAVGGALGSYAVLRGQSLLGDAVSHAALPGIALAFLLTGSRSPVILLSGALVTGWAASYLVSRVADETRIKYDGALATLLAVFFGIGLLLLTFIQKRPDARQAGLDTFLFGQAATLLQQDVIVMAVMGGAALALAALFWKEFKMLTFDPAYGNTAGFAMKSMDVLLTTLLVVAIVVGLQAVGVVLMSAMLIAPAAAARQWTDRLSVMVILAGVFGAGAGIGGTLISGTAGNMPTGPAIVLVASALVAVSLLAAPRRGLLWAWFASRSRGRRLHEDAILMDLYRMAIQHADPSRPHAEAAIGVLYRERIRTALSRLEQRGLVRGTGPAEWQLTETGIARARDLMTIENGNGYRTG